MSGLFHTFLYVPIYNLLVFLADIVPGGDVGLAVVFATVIVKVVLMPLSLRAVRTQRQMKLIEPQLKELKEKYKNDRERQAKEMMALYREHGVRPFASILGLIIQLPIIIALYLVFSRAAIFNIDPTLLYSFVPVPTVISPLFLGIFSVAGKSVALAVLAALAQFALAYVSIPVPKASTGEKRSATEDFGRMMAVQARYFLPLMIGVVGFVTSGAVALYFITASLVGLLQELVVRKMERPAVPRPKQAL
ncbi:MAG: YidC/Oxa1 family rane protein insertase [Candidatus Parcubacteria bacterium]|jgi:YidC/Oxa1 family membrane protein insertase|nr:YidC/Oxa1 family rane protein insertase [Candidatus Parcubacteria bacterium]